MSIKSCSQPHFEFRSWPRTSFAARERAGASERANGPMVARVSGSLALGHQRRGIAGASHARDYRRPMWAPGSHNPGGGVLRPAPNDRRR